MKKFVFVLLLCGCAAPVKLSVPKPKITVVNVNTQVQPWTTIEELSTFRPLVYFYFDSAQGYEVDYLTPFGRMSFSRTEVVAGGSGDFWPNVLAEFNYYGDKEKLFYIGRDVVRAAPCWIKVRAHTPQRMTAWSDSIFVP